MIPRITTVRMKPESFPIDIHRDKAKGWPCPYCWVVMDSARYPTWDHLVPLSQGGPNVDGNKIPVCRLCNARKSSLSLPAFVGKLMAMGDPQYPCTAAFLEYLIDIAGRDTAFETQCYGEVGRACMLTLISMRKPLRHRMPGVVKKAMAARVLERVDA
jgi:hypothetical protein